MPIRLRTSLALPALCVAALVLSSCGDGPDGDPTPTTDTGATSTQGAGSTASGTAGSASGTAVNGSPTPLPTGIPGDYGTEPLLGDNVETISPAWAASVKQSETRTANPERPGGICADVNFDGLPQTALWFRMAVNGTEVTEDLTWIVDSKEAPTRGRVCYAPEEGLPIGRNQVAIVVSNPNGSESPRQSVAWEFDVTE